MRMGQLFVNGKKVVETYAKWDRGYEYDMKIVDGGIYSREYDGQGGVGPWLHNVLIAPDSEQSSISRAKPEAVPANMYMVLGDYRSNSNDSHVWGFAHREAFRHRPMILFWPLSRLRVLN
jgi:signal peptidase I